MDGFCENCGEPLDDCCNINSSGLCCDCHEYFEGEENIARECDNCGRPVEVEGLCEECEEEGV